MVVVQAEKDNSRAAGVLLLRTPCAKKNATHERGLITVNCVHYHTVFLDALLKSKSVGWVETKIPL